MMKQILNVLLIFLFVANLQINASAWSCLTHQFIAEKAGIEYFKLACIPDASQSENSALLQPFHFHNAAPNTIVTPEYIDKYKTFERYFQTNCECSEKPKLIYVPHNAGILYWKIIDLYNKMISKKYPGDYDYSLINLSHYIADLSQPLHNYIYGDEPASDGKIYPKEGQWAKNNHKKFDEAFDKLKKSIALKPIKIKNISISSVDDLKREICIIANASIKIADGCFKENREMKDEEIMSQIELSVSLLHAIILQH